MPPKSIFRQPGAKHFQLVHRSQRDPLIHDPDASQHVLKPFERENNKKGKSRAELEEILPASELSTNIGEAALYGVYYDDSDYNYMQHLRPVGVQEDGVDSVWVEAPVSTKKGKSKGIALKDLPDGVLASTSELPRTYESQQAVPASIAGFQPDMDPHLRQVLEALEDDAFVEDDLEDDFFGELVADGERGSDDEVDFEFSEEGVLPEGATPGDGEEQEGDDGTGWEARFSQFKKTQTSGGEKSDDEYDGSEDGDTVGGLPTMSVIGGKKRRKGTSDASGYSMSSSSMYRNEALQTLDERFDQMILKQYNSDEESEPSEEDDADDDAPELITSRADFESMMDEFLNDYEILGRKLKPKLEGDSGAAKLDTLRRAMGQDERVRATQEDEDEDDGDVLMPLDIDDRKDRWDCETILTTYSNLENHPRLIRARDSDRKKTVVPKIHLDPRTGFPTIAADTKPASKPTGRVSFTSDSNSESSDDDDDRPRVQTIKRDKNESKEEKKARKAAVKEERQARRVEKKSTKELYGAELKTQKRAIANKERRLKSL
ncbi:Protein LTV1 [Mycena sanguinolenta]|uniref:Protein LTV1 n=1 Tax=Mycena sanguinolenta TaxID=230812 RepID=A0A8H6XBV7_9AGAR|nr:Protein LTV1 [Mycena sanguinolenta]